MKHRLQGYVADFGACAINAFDLNTWQKATTLAHFGVELKVHSGAMRVMLMYVSPAGHSTTFAVLDCDGPGSAFSPPIFLNDLDGALLPVIESHSNGVEYDLYFGTDDTPATPWSKVGYLFGDPVAGKATGAWATHCAEMFNHYIRIYGDQGKAHLAITCSGEAQHKDYGPNVSLLPSSSDGRALYEAAYGTLSRLNFTHLCQIGNGLWLNPEMFARTTAFLRYLRPGFQVTAPSFLAKFQRRGPALRPDKSICFGFRAADRAESPDHPVGSGIKSSDLKSLLALPRNAEITNPSWRILALSDLHQVGMPCSLLGPEAIAEHDLRLRAAGVSLVTPFSFWALCDQKAKPELGPQHDPTQIRSRWVRFILRSHSDVRSVLRETISNSVQAAKQARKSHHAAAISVALSDFLAGPNSDLNDPQAGSPDISEAHFQALLVRLDQTAAALCAAYQDACAHASTIGYWARGDQGRTASAVGNLQMDILTLQHQLAAAHAKMESLRAELHRTQQVESERISNLLRRNQLEDTPQVLGDLNRANLVALNFLHRRHEGQRAFVIGNGPSLRIADLDLLHNEITFASNKIYLAFDDTNWRPTYYSVEDSLVMQQNHDRIASLKGTTKIFPDNMREFGYHEADTIFMRMHPPLSFEEPLSDPDFPDFSTDLRHGICWGSTIVYSQIQMALYMGCSEIILIGVDHNYQLPKNRRGRFHVHEGEQNHFHPEYRSPGEVWHHPNLEVLEVSFARAFKRCAEHGVPVLNASRKSRLDVFERVEFDSLF